MSSSREIFANTIMELGDHTNLSANECERFGMTWGCKRDCPVFERGECEIQEENKAIFDKEDNQNN